MLVITALRVGVVEYVIFTERVWIMGGGVSGHHHRTCMADGWVSGSIQIIIHFTL